MGNEHEGHRGQTERDKKATVCLLPRASFQQRKGRLAFLLLHSPLSYSGIFSSLPIALPLLTFSLTLPFTLNPTRINTTLSILSTMTDKLKLFYLLDGVAENAFSVEPPLSKTVDGLKKLNKDKNPNALIGIDSNLLTLWLPSRLLMPSRVGHLSWTRVTPRQSLNRQVTFLNTLMKCHARKQFTSSSVVQRKVMHAIMMLINLRRLRCFMQ